MNSEDIAISWRPLVLLMLMIGAPPIAAIFIIKPNLLSAAPTTPDTVVGVVACLICLGITAAVAFFMVTRRAVQLFGDTLVIKHSFYTFKINKTQARGVEVDEVQSYKELGISIKTNGIAAFGYLSGRFRSRSGKRMFCAVARFPAFRFQFDGNARCPQLALSCSREMAAAIRDWAGR